MRKIVLILPMLMLAQGAFGQNSSRELCRDKFDQMQERVKQNPADTEAWQDLRVCVTELKRWHEGDVIASQTLKKNPDHSEAHLLLGVTRLHSKAYAKAAESFDDAIRTKPSNPQAYYYLGMSYLFQNLPLEASKAAERAVELEPEKAANHGQLAYAYFLLDESDKCEKAALKAIALDRNNVAAYKVLGNLYAKQGRQAESDKMFEAAIHANGRIAASAPVMATKKALPGMAPGASVVSPPIPEAAVSEKPDAHEAPQNKQEVEILLSRQWRGMKDALIAGNIPKALTYYSDYADTREAYRKAFEKMSIARLRKIYTSMGELEDCSVVLLAADCTVTISSGGTLHVTKVRFERNPDKVWRIRAY